MKLKEFINEDKIYTQVENEIREWVENTYEDLSIDFYPNFEIVGIDENVDYAKKYDKEQVKKITEIVNIKIGEIMEAHAEEIYIAEKLTKIWNKYPRFSIDVNSIDDIKENKKFLKRFKEIGENYGRAK